GGVGFPGDCAWGTIDSQRWRWGMVYEELRELVNRTPFVPLRLYLSDGNQINVWHKEMIIVARRSVSVGLPLTPESTEADRTALLDLLHIVRVEPLDPPPPPAP